MTCTHTQVYGVLPASAIFMVMYGWASNRLSKRALFYSTCIPFFAFYALFCTLIYPNRAMLMPKVPPPPIPACIAHQTLDIGE